MQEPGKDLPPIPPIPVAPAVPPAPGAVLSPAPYPSALAPVHPASTSGFAVASLVLGILWIWWIGSILAVIFGFVARAQIKRSHGMLTGDGLAIAGIVLGFLGIAGFVILVIAAATTTTTPFG